jgi:integrase
MVETVALRKEISRPSVKKFVEECLASGMASPSEMRDAYETQWKKKYTDKAFLMAMRRNGVSSEQRKQIAEEAKKQTVCKDISEYQQVKNYLRRAEISRITELHMKRQLGYLRELWTWMDCSNPETWTFANLIDTLEKHIHLKTDDRGRKTLEELSKALKLLGAFNTMFSNILPEGWSNGFSREAGELKDYFSFEEYNEFKVNLHDTQVMSRIGWLALFDAQENMGCREGTLMHTGIMSLEWQDINYETRRCNLRDKGGRGKAARLWKNVPLDLFPWLDGWNELLKWHEQKFGYTPTNERHETGRVFPLHYQDYREMFHATRRRCNGRIAGDLETMTPHVLRKTHAQWCRKLRIPLEQICGQFPDGRMGVGWDNPKILLDFYITIEDDEFEESEKRARERILKLGLAPLAAWEKSSLWRDHAFLPRLEESSNLLCRNVE